MGFQPSYGSEAFNDHHFHYGYFTWAAALLGMHDRRFLADYGEMARLVAKEYANWDRDDKRFPFLRTFDVWEGHSWAGGTSSPGGNNQESSSEAVQSWAGLILLGEALADRHMTAAGVLGYSMETEATLEYWFNRGGDVFPAQWKHPVTGMVWSGGKVYGTYFTGDPAWIYAIQWLPASPALDYLVRDPQFARKSYANMLHDFEGKEHKPGTIKTFGPALGSVMLGYVLMYDPAWAARQLDALWLEPGDKVAHDASEMAIMYYMAHAMCGLGRVDWSLSHQLAHLGSLFQPGYEDALLRSLEPAACAANGRGVRQGRAHRAHDCGGPGPDPRHKVVAAGGTGRFFGPLRREKCASPLAAARGASHVDRQHGQAPGGGEVQGPQRGPGRGWRLAGGKQISVPLARLSPEDQALVARQAKP